MVSIYAMLNVGAQSIALHICALNDSKSLCTGNFKTMLHVFASGKILPESSGRISIVGCIRKPFEGIEEDPETSSRKFSKVTGAHSPSKINEQLNVSVAGRGLRCSCRESRGT